MDFEVIQPGLPTPAVPSLRRDLSEQAFKRFLPVLVAAVQHYPNPVKLRWTTYGLRWSTFLARIRDAMRSWTLYKWEISHEALAQPLPEDWHARLQELTVEAYDTEHIRIGIGTRTVKWKAIQLAQMQALPMVDLSSTQSSTGSRALVASAPPGIYDSCFMAEDFENFCKACAAFVTITQLCVVIPPFKLEFTHIEAEDLTTHFEITKRMETLRFELMMSSPNFTLFVEPTVIRLVYNPPQITDAREQTST